MKLLFVVGARPNFIKIAPLMTVAQRFPEITSLLVHTGQHYDARMSQVFFEELNIPQPDFNLNVGSASQARQTADIMVKFEELCLTEHPEAVVVIGDVNSTLAAALTAAKLGITIAHIEAGLRSFNRTMPEEINRVVADHLSDLLFAPSQTAMDNLYREGLADKAYFTGDVMYDALLRHLKIAESTSNILAQLNLAKKQYYFATLHRPYNVDQQDVLAEILAAYAQLDAPVVFSVHPRTIRNITTYQLTVAENILVHHPFGYLDCLLLEKYAKKIITDSGGMQKEAYFLRVPCITLRPETEWVETLAAGANVLIKNRRKEDIISTVRQESYCDFTEGIYGDGTASEKMIHLLLQSKTS